MATQIQPEVIAPIVHLNGTGRESLMEQRDAFYESIYAAAEKLRQMAPNGRDYYPAGPEALAKAEAQHRRRQEVLASLMAEIEAEMEMIQD